MNKLINALGFQTGWWACIAGVGQGFELEAIGFCAILAGAHLYFAQFPQQELKLAALAWILGVLLDSSLQQFAVIDFYGWALGPLSPFWLWALWVLFALTLNSSLAFLQRQPLLLSTVLGLVFGPLTYYAGAKLGAAGLDGSPVNLLSLALAWMLAMPLLVMAAQYTSHPSEDNT